MKYFLFTISFLFTFIIADENKIDITKESEVLVYSNYFWAPCDEAKSLLKSRGIEYKEQKITFSRKKQEELSKISNGRTSTPQLVVDGNYFGGLEKLKTYFAKQK